MDNLIGERDTYDAPPAVSFYFNVHFVGPEVIPDMAFLEVSGLKLEMQVKEVHLGGGYVRKMPVRQKHGNLICKCPIRPVSTSSLEKWIETSMQGGVDEDIVAWDIIVSLLNSEGDPFSAWYLSSAYPVKWDVGTFDSKKNEIAVETLEFAYDTLKRVM